MTGSHASGDPPLGSTAGAGARRWRPRARREHGFVTAETAVALPSLVLVALMLAWVVALVTMQLECVDAARAGARAYSRGESVEASRSAALEAAPTGSTVDISRSGDFIRVEVALRVEPSGGLVGFIPGVTVNGEAHAIAEDAVGLPRESGSVSELADSELADFELADFELADPELADFELADFELADPELADHELADHELADSELANPVQLRVLGGLTS